MMIPDTTISTFGDNTMDWILIYLAFHCTICFLMTLRNGRRNVMLLAELEDKERELYADLEERERKMYADLEQRERAIDKTEEWLDKRERKLEECQRRYEFLVK